MNSRGFTIVELLIVITVIAILVPTTLFTMRGLTTTAQDRERESDATSIARQLELVYKNKTVDASPTYPGTTALAATTTREGVFGGSTVNITRAPSVNTFSIVPATSASSISPTPTATTYVYQPLDASNALCASLCSKFNLYYLKASNNTVVTIKSNRQQ